MTREHDLKSISKDGTYHYTDIVSERMKHSEMLPWEKKQLKKKFMLWHMLMEK